LRLAEHFKAFSLALSLDGVGAQNEYIRYPSRWDEVVANLEVLRSIPNIHLSSSTTLMAYNALDLVEVLRFLDAQGISLFVNPLFDPYYLRADVLPPQARRLAAQRLRAYAASDCRPEHQAMVAALAKGLEPERDTVDEQALREFARFTHDLDVARGQNFGATFRELADLIADAGVDWPTETVFAERPALPLVAG
jgi:MoaA/NifB/PqqE/SkfB family radical SAM enzyme